MNQSKVEHTETPWQVDFGCEIFKASQKSGTCLAITKFNVEEMNPMEIEIAKANAKFIVRACNLHYTLVKTLKNTQIYLRDFNFNSEGMADVLNEIESALKLAEGGVK